VRHAAHCRPRRGDRPARDVLYRLAFHSRRDPLPAHAPGMSRNAPIGVFDSGVGGLTVLKALAAQLPRERFVYLGDTARLPYGTKSAGTVVRYALQAAEALAGFEVKCLVLACNTASAVGLAAVS